MKKGKKMTYSNSPFGEYFASMESADMELSKLFNMPKSKKFTVPSVFSESEIPMVKTKKGK